ncbi:MAG: O-antigen/teichoic acid export membrane protein [Paraglaciecola sp.]
MNGIKKALSWSFASNYLMILVRFASVAIVARLLTPDEIGIFSIAMAGFGFLQMFRDFGVGSYIIQHKNLKPSDLAATFSVSLIICWCLAALSFVSADAIGDFYGRDEVAVIFKFLAINLIIIPFGTINLALLSRKRMFKHLAILNVCSAVIGSMSVVVAAYQGYSYLSPAIGSIAGCLATVVVSNIFRQKELPFLPGRKGIKEVLKFGSLISTSNIVDHLSQTGPELIIGKTLGIEAVAFFNKGSATAQLMNRLILSSVRGVAGPFFAEYNRNNTEKLKSVFLKFQDYIVVLAWPFLIFLGYFADESMLILYGPQWSATAELLPYFCIGLALSCPFALTNQLLISTGNVKANLSLQTKITLLKLLVVVLASTYSLKLTVTLLMILPLIRMCLIAPLLKEILQVSIFSLKDNLIKWLAIAGCFFVFLFISDQALKYYGLKSVVNIFIIGPTSLGLWLYLLFMFNHPLFEECRPVLDKLKKIVKLN